MTNPPPLPPPLPPTEPSAATMQTPQSGQETAQMRRLHPLSWFFSTIHEVQKILFPLIVMAIASIRGPRSSLVMILIMVVALLGNILFSVWRYFTYQYSIESSAIVIRSGLFSRSLRHVPFAKIHNVALRRNLLHRLFNVAEVHLESAGGQTQEAQMRVLHLADANALEALIRQQAHAAQAHTAAALATPTDTHADTLAHSSATTPVAEQSTQLLRLSMDDIVRLGLTSYRGLVVVMMVVAIPLQILQQLLSVLPQDYLLQIFETGKNYLHDQNQLISGTPQWIWLASSAFGFLVFLGVLLVFSVLFAWVKYHDFVLEEEGRRLTVEQGLFNRLRSSMPRRRIQTWRLRQNLLQRVLRRYRLSVSTAVSNMPGAPAQSLNELAPLATQPVCDGLIQHLLPHVQWPPAQLQRLPARAVLANAIPSVLYTLLLAAVVGVFLNYWLALAVLVIGALALGLAWLRLHYTRWSIDAQLLVVRSGWLSRCWRFIEIDKLQTIELQQGPWQRIFDLASLSFDSAGQNTLPGAQMKIIALPRPQAEALLGQLQQQIAKLPQRW